MPFQLYVNDTEVFNANSQNIIQPHAITYTNTRNVILTAIRFSNKSIESYTYSNKIFQCLIGISGISRYKWELGYIHIRYTAKIHFGLQSQFPQGICVISQPVEER